MWAFSFYLENNGCIYQVLDTLYIPKAWRSYDIGEVAGPVAVLSKESKVLSTRVQSEYQYIPQLLTSLNKLSTLAIYILQAGRLSCKDPNTSRPCFLR